MSFPLRSGVGSRTGVEPTPTLSAPGPKGELVVADGRRVLRFRADGRSQRHFGDRGGVAGASLGPMEASGLAVDSRDRPVLTGFSTLTPSFCNKTPVYLNTTIVARLTAGGAPACSPTAPPTPNSASHIGKGKPASWAPQLHPVVASGRSRPTGATASSSPAPRCGMKTTSCPAGSWQCA